MDQEPDPFTNRNLNWVLDSDPFMNENLIKQVPNPIFHRLELSDNWKIGYPFDEDLEFHSHAFFIFYFSLPLPAIEFSERLTYFGIATNLIIYLTKILHQDLKTAAKNVNYWAGVTTMMPLIGGFLADAYLGRFSAILGSSIIYLMVISISMLYSFLTEVTASSHDGPH